MNAVLCKNSKTMILQKQGNKKTFHFQSQNFATKFIYPVSSAYKTKYSEGHFVTCGILQPPCQIFNGPFLSIVIMCCFDFASYDQTSD